jgi:DNA-binding transcriptional ArsR family regulator
MTEAQKLARMFKALSVDTRVRMVQILKSRTLCVGALSARLDITQGAVSQHLRILRDADIVVPEKRGYYVHYRLNEKTLLKWKHAIERFLRKENETEVPGNLGNRRETEAMPCVGERRAARGRSNESRNPRSAYLSRSKNAPEPSMNLHGSNPGEKNRENE